MKLMNLRVAAGVAASLILAGGAFAWDDVPYNEAVSEEAEDTVHAECSDRTIQGDYAFSVEGSILNGPAQGLLRVVGVARYDGEGHFTQVDFPVINGAPQSPDWRPGSGTYQINANCTGAGVIAPAGGAPPIAVRMVISDRGRRIRSVVIGNPTAAEATRIR